MKREDLLKIAKPILFNTEMVRIILDGSKEQTRRVIKPRSRKACGFYIATRKTDGTVEGVYDYDENERMFDNPQPLPYNPGDILYVRESWQNVYETEYFREPCSDKPYEAKNIRELIKNFDTLPKTEAELSRTDCHYSDSAGTKYYVYKASDIEYADGDNFLHWRPSIHMPKEAARIFLKVTNVRAEQLQDITLVECCMEGVEPLPIAYNDPDNAYLQAREMFKSLWDSTIKKADRDKYSWDANPYVWVIEFEKLNIEVKGERGGK